MSDQERIKKACRRIADYVSCLSRETGKLIDPPDFEMCEQMLDLIAIETDVCTRELAEWKAEERG
jgi:hypothetical protein